ncbi:hypothetical protein [Litoreibacter arenae]|uniref:Uncharacterized protein n=1 Tax=Litoreibacter arenae DSM 19593 TaxID=1123360 RepID=S9QJM3_9RHOB|nr:hypothetical protein [Litoreibacter arenae]EPX81621.1 hypothetical protein thalar_00177 [Litoreibacter arenae DSM 19593]
MMPLKKGPEPITDLLDFYDRWPLLRVEMKALSEGNLLNEDERETLSWLILLADRVGPADLRD